MRYKKRPGKTEVRQEGSRGSSVDHPNLPPKRVDIVKTDTEYHVRPSQSHPAYAQWVLKVKAMDIGQLSPETLRGGFWCFPRSYYKKMMELIEDVFSKKMWCNWVDERTDQPKPPRKEMTLQELQNEIQLLNEVVNKKLLDHTREEKRQKKNADIVASLKEADNY